MRVTICLIFADVPAKFLRIDSIVRLITISGHPSAANSARSSDIACSNSVAASFISVLGNSVIFTEFNVFNGLGMSGVSTDINDFNVLRQFQSGSGVEQNQ
jgi:hypothetical protein